MSKLLKVGLFFGLIFFFGISCSDKVSTGEDQEQEQGVEVGDFAVEPDAVREVRDEDLCTDNTTCEDGFVCHRGDCVEMTGAIWMKHVWDRMPAQVLPKGCSKFENIYYVSISGVNQEGRGSEAEPYRTIQYSVDNAGECSLIRVKKGRYKESVFIKNQNKIAIEGDDRFKTIIDAGLLVKNWKPVSSGQCIGNSSCIVYKKTLPYKVEHVSVDYKTAVGLGQNLVDENNTSLRPNAPICPRAQLAKCIGILNYGPVFNKEKLTWHGVEAAYFISPNGQGHYDYYLKLYAGEKDARKRRITISHPEGTGAALRIGDASSIVVRNMTFVGGRYGISIYRDVKDVIVEGNRLIGGYRVVSIQGKESAQPRDVEIRRNYINLNLAANTDPTAKNANSVFWIVKGGSGDLHGVYIGNVGENVRVHHNYFPNGMNGVQDYSYDMGAKKASEFNRYLEVDHNYLANMLDDCLEPSSSEYEAKWHDNFLENCSHGIRLKLLSKKVCDEDVLNLKYDPKTCLEPVSIGPLYIYKNVVMNPHNYDYDNLPEHQLLSIYFYTGTFAKAFIYNNTFIGFMGNVFGPTNAKLGAENLVFINNVFSEKYPIPNQRMGSWPRLQEKDKMPIFDYNLFAGKLDKQMSIMRDDGKVKNLFRANDFLRMGNHNIDIADNIGRYVYKDAYDFCIPDSLTNDFTGVNVSTDFALEYIDAKGIKRKIDYQSLPGMEFEGVPCKGPFPKNSNSCNHLEWLLE